jgi:HD-GYP domain-containing protein (c-di-GMP phosphodiesterase class II)
MRRHPAVGARIVGSTAGLAYLARLIRAEHERWDGCGYPDGLGGQAIPLASRIVFACDAYHAMTSNRPYRRALPGGVAAAELRRGAGTQFCPRTVGALLAVLEDPERRFAWVPVRDGCSPSLGTFEVS